MLGNRFRHCLLVAVAMVAALTVSAQELVEMTTTQAKNYYKNVNRRRVTCHDPSVVWEPTKQKYYIFGSHLAMASTSDLQNWTSFRAPWGAVQADGTVKSGVSNAEAFATHQVKTVKIGGEDVAFGNFNVHDWSAAYGNGYNINGNLWAPDVIYLEKMKKWCMYMSVNGPTWNSSIVLLTSDNIEGPYVYQGPVVFSGFFNTNNATITYKNTDLELVIGKQNSLPARYNHGQSSSWGETWGDYMPHCIDPCVFYDEEGQLWMSYGSWSGGIWMLKLDDETGLRDYDVTYSLTGSGKNISSDPYFGKKIAGGYYVSGEASYIEYIGEYYYLFMSYGGLESTGGYQMRVFRSKNPDGPYLDGQNRNAIFDRYVLNFGVNADRRGQLIMGSYDKWGLMEKGELAQGHNSVIAAPDGRSYLVYHTRFNDGTEGHQVRTHQLYVNKNGWLVASPFEYSGGTTTDADIASKNIIPTEQIPGKYSLLVHSYSLDHAEREVVTPVEITLSSDGKVSGAYTGTWKVEEGNSYFTIILGGVAYNGVLVDEQMDVKSLRAITFTTCTSSGVHAWGYKLRDDYALAYQLNNQKEPVTNGQNVSTHLDFESLLVSDGVKMEWTSSQPDILSETGRYNPIGYTEDVPVELGVRLSAGNYFWQQNYSVTAKAETLPTADWLSGIVGHYAFDSTVTVNSVDSTQRVLLMMAGTNKRPTLNTDGNRNGKVIHLTAGGNKNESFARIPNPLQGAELTDGFTISFWVKRMDNNVWDALFSFYNSTDQSRLYMTGGAYVGYNNNAGNWIDINHPNSYKSVKISTGTWHLVNVAVSRSAAQGVKVYVDGMAISDGIYKGSLNGKDVNKAALYDYNLLVDHVANSPLLYLGYGSFWGTPDVYMDEVVVHDRVLSFLEIRALNQMMNRVFDIGEAAGIENVPMDVPVICPLDNIIYDLSGRRVEKPVKGVYIRNGKKFVVK